MNNGKDITEVEFVPLETDTPAPVEPAVEPAPVAVPEPEPVGV